MSSLVPKAVVPQSTTAPLPPIPKMDPGTPGVATAATLRNAIRDAARAVRQDAKQARADAKAAAKDAQIAAKDAITAAREGQGQGGIPGTVPPPPQNNSDDIPPQVMQIVSMFFVFVVVLVLGTPIVRAIMRRFDRKTESMRVTGPDVTPHLRQLQESVDAMAIEIERISEGQRFTSKLLASRASAAPAVAERQARD